MVRIASNLVLNTTRMSLTYDPMRIANLDIHKILYYALSTKNKGFAMW